MIPIYPEGKAPVRPSARRLDLDAFLVEDKASGDYRLHRQAFTDEDLFELEMKHIFEGNWIYLAHESQIPNNNDYYTTHIGRQPVVIARNRQGELNAFINACSHRGAMLCRHKRGNKATYTCPFHGWTFNNSGKLLKVKDPENAGYPDCFNKEGSHDLKKVARFENYRGFLFGSLNADVPPLQDFLGEAARVIDMIVDQSADGLEVLRGSSTYTFEGNWKLQAENGADGYHVSAVHWNYAATTSQRKQKNAQEDKIRAMDAGKWGQQGGGFYAFEHGHMLLWTRWANPEDRPNFSRREEFAERCGAETADWMIQNSRNLCLYPNVYLMDQFGSQIRLLRPLAVDKTEVTIYCIAPKGESDEARARRIRQYEDFFNVSGMATPDDLEEFRACQQGYAGQALTWNDMCRGAKHWIDGADEAAQRIGLKPVMSGVRTEDEGLYTVQHRYWLDVMKKAVAEQSAEAANEATDAAAGSAA
ncbi:Benzoate 1,2-dioxygenase alpha subunit [Cupriavidus necator H850]|jgi:benzoate/toluate 1,2-dioxygenase alpha subunit|uniref:benzoate 1,2-dioxygenase large subunit n=1 Tax=Cupriavidus necator TaxID=106590 RepID=UPI00129D824A|nr:benzoate 1,2-dioxygenase large subunit [Cupriavidus necator]KAI3607322.1 Benzoate 1,2-dioxygenase alpha subunit [Cupriavidus necator H850]